jgi:hypothetical protein
MKDSEIEGFIKRAITDIARKSNTSIDHIKDLIKNIL